MTELTKEILEELSDFCESQKTEYVSIRVSGLRSFIAAARERDELREKVELLSKIAMKLAESYD